jgi:hypothetical protein
MVRPNAYPPTALISFLVNSNASDEYADVSYVCTACISSYPARGSDRWVADLCFPPIQAASLGTPVLVPTRIPPPTPRVHTVPRTCARHMPCAAARAVLYAAVERYARGEAGRDPMALVPTSWWMVLVRTYVVDGAVVSCCRCCGELGPSWWVDEEGLYALVVSSSLTTPSPHE